MKYLPLLTLILALGAGGYYGYRLGYAEAMAKQKTINQYIDGGYNANN